LLKKKRRKGEMSQPNQLQEILSNPIALLIYLPFLPLIILANVLGNPPPLPFPAAETRNVEEWIIREDPETGEIRVTVHRNVRRS